MIVAVPFSETTVASLAVATCCQEVTPRYFVLALIVSCTVLPSGRASVIWLADTAVAFPRSKVTVCQVAAPLVAPFTLISMVPWSARRKRSVPLRTAEAGGAVAAVAASADEVLIAAVVEPVLPAAHATVPAPTRTAPATATPAIFLPSESFIFPASFTGNRVGRRLFSPQSRRWV